MRAMYDWWRTQRRTRWLGVVRVLMLASVLVMGWSPFTAFASQPGIGTAASWAHDGAWFQRLIALYASGNAPIQQEALATGTQIGLTDGQVLAIEQAVRQAWVQLMRADPATLGHIPTRANPTGQQAVLGTLRATLHRLTGPRYAAFLSASDAAYQRVFAPAWLRAHDLAQQLPARHATSSTASSTTSQGYVSAYATSFELGGSETLANGQTLAPNDAYVALPDVYLKYTNLGWYSSIPQIYQPYYMGTSSTGPYPLYTVDIADSAGTLKAGQVVVGDVGPWNEDDNWWDPTATSTTLPDSCPVSSTLASAFSLNNAQVDGICPGLWNWRRVGYYLLYQHAGLPFFGPSGYAPSGGYADTSAWPPTLPRYCPEASAASINADGVTCSSALPNYNANNGSWLRSGSYDSPILNQAGIDLSPGVDTALGWTWPSSGFIQVDVSRLPIGVNGTAGTPHIAVSPSTLISEGISGNNPPAQTLTLTNTGSGSLTWSATSLPAWLSLSATSGTVAPNSSQTLTASFDASQMGGSSVSGQFTLTGSGADNSPVVVHVVATLSRPLADWTFPDVHLMPSADATLTLVTPATAGAQIQIRYESATGAVQEEAISMPAESVRTLDVGLEAGASFTGTIVVSASEPVLATLARPVASLATSSIQIAPSTNNASNTSDTATSVSTQVTPSATNTASQPQGMRQGAESTSGTTTRVVGSNGQEMIESFSMTWTWIWKALMTTLYPHHV